MRLPADAPIRQELVIPRRMVGLLLGPRGATVGRLRRESGAKVHVGPEPADSQAQVGVVGGRVRGRLGSARCGGRGAHGPLLRHLPLRWE
jgi:hypothetical protein